MVVINKYIHKFEGSGGIQVADGLRKADFEYYNKSTTTDLLVFESPEIFAPTLCLHLLWFWAQVAVALVRCEEVGEGGREGVRIALRLVTGGNGKPVEVELGGQLRKIIWTEGVLDVLVLRQLRGV